MRTLQNNFTTPEQSRRLMELGLPADSAECIIASYEGHIKRSIFSTELPTYSIFMAAVRETPSIRRAINQHENYIPCWSVGRVGEIYLTCIDEAVYPDIFSPAYFKGDVCEKLVNDLCNNRHILDFSKLEE